MEQTVREAFDNLLSTVCNCGHSKQRAKSFCYHCYKSLPQKFQADLYKSIGSGYREAYQQACDYLERNLW